MSSRPAAALAWRSPYSRCATTRARACRQVRPRGARAPRTSRAAAADARTALSGTTDDHLHTGWRLKARGEVVQDASRLQMIQDAFNHWSHHRGQMTVYLRLMGEPVPALYGPSADDSTW